MAKTVSIWITLCLTSIVVSVEKVVKTFKVKIKKPTHYVIVYLAAYCCTESPFSTHRAIKHVLNILTPFSTGNGGPLTLDHVVYVEGRGNLIIGYTPEGASGTIGFIGSHLDVVPANPKTWDRDPFKLTIEVSVVYYSHSHCFSIILFLLSNI